LSILEIRQKRSENGYYGTIGMVQVELAFGKTNLTLELPAGFRYQVLAARSARPLADWEGAIAAALREPVGRPPLEEMARGKRTAAISVCDITRPAPNSKTLPHILGALERGGIRPENITILIATGLHRAATEAEIRQIVSEPIAARYRVANHDARNLAGHRPLGETAAGTPVHIDERFVAADLHITLGFIEPHLMLGFSGGRKLIAPGLAAQETIKALHSPKFMRDARATEGSTADNPLHHELLEIARMAGHDFMLDVALARERSIAGVFAGDPEQAHRRGVEFVSRTLLETLEEPVDAAITSAAGYPLDLTFYQTVKGVTAAAHIVKPGGRILVVGACDEGAGAPEFREMLLAGISDTAFLKQIASAPVVVDQWQLEKLALVTTERQLFYYVPGLPAECHAKLWGRSLPTPESAVEAVLAGLPAGARVAVIPEGPYVLANCRAVLEPEATVS
jgi:lactate racemase